MHTPEKIAGFIDLRSKGYSLADIAATINVSKTTLVAWNKTYFTELAENSQEAAIALNTQAARAAEAVLQQLEAIKKRVSRSIDGSLANLDKLSIIQKFRLQFLLIREMQRLHELEIKSQERLARLLKPIPTPKENKQDQSQPAKQSNSGQVETGKRSSSGQETAIPSNLETREIGKIPVQAKAA